MSPADRAEWDARQPLLPGVKWPGFKPRSLEVLYAIAIEALDHWEGAWMAADLFETGETRVAYWQAWAWDRVAKDLHRALAARVRRGEAA